MSLIKLTILLTVFFIVLNGNAQAQEKIEKSGKVTYISSQNIYVQFENTDGIKQGDTLYSKIKQRLLPAIQVNFISSRSCAGIKINGANLKLDDQIFALVYAETKGQVLVSDTITVHSIPQTSEQQLVVQKPTKTHLKKATSNGRFSVQSYSSINPGSINSTDQRWRYTFSYDAQNIEESGFSFSSYFNYAYSVADWAKVKDKPWNNLKVYDLSLGYDFDTETSIRLGRYINPRISNISSVDGLQFQKKFSDFFSGIVIGYRPDFSTLGYNSKLFEYGGYIGRTDTIEDGIMENTIAFFQQTNNFKTDRRFMYFQHNNSILKDFYLSLSSELDLFALESGIGKTKPSLTSFFLSTRYSPSRIVSFSFSYDARKNVIYYETFRNTIDSLFENETRQGIRLGTNIRPISNIYIGLNAGYRFLKKDAKPSKNINGYVTYSQVPIIDISSTLSYSQLNSSYVDGAIYGIRFSKYLSFIDYSLSFSYSKVEYKYLTSAGKLNQNNVSIDLSGRLLGQLFQSFSYEGVFEQQLNYGRILFDLSFRF